MGGFSVTHAIESGVDVYELHRQVVLGEDLDRRTEAIGILRSLIEEERCMPHSGMAKSYLRVSEMVLEILEETIPSQDGVI
jgi:hypothetical protein